MIAKNCTLLFAENCAWVVAKNCTLLIASHNICIWRKAYYHTVLVLMIINPAFSI